MSKAFLALAGAALLAACGSDNNTTTPPAQTQAQLATTLCTALATNCPGGGADDQFENETELGCEDSVKTVYNMSVTDSNSKNDDLTCRAKEAAAAGTDAANKAAHCKNAGPTGGSSSATAGAGNCGGLCDVYCDLQDRNCTSANPAFVTAGIAAPNFPDHATCLSSCQAEVGKGVATHFQTDGTVNDHGSGAPGGGHHDTLQCRIWHLGKAQAGPSPHCFHTRLISATNAAGATAGAPCSDT